MFDTKAMNSKFTNNFLQKFIINNKQEAVYDSKIETNYLTVDNIGILFCINVYLKRIIPLIY